MHQHHSVRVSARVSVLFFVSSKCPCRCGCRNSTRKPGAHNDSFARLLNLGHCTPRCHCACPTPTPTYLPGCCIPNGHPTAPPQKKESKKQKAGAI